MDKHKKYRAKMMTNGKCPRCGKSSFPYRLCAKHRYKLAVWRRIKTLVDAGMIVMENGGYRFTEKAGDKIGYNIKKRDRRKLPRMEGRPMDDDAVVKIITEVLDSIQRPLTEKEIKMFMLRRKNKKLS